MAGDLLTKLANILADITASRELLMSVADEMDSVPELSKEECKDLDGIYDSFAELFGHSDEAVAAFGEASTKLQERSGVPREE